MAQQTFTVPTTGVYRSADGARNVNYAAGDVVPMEVAVDLQMPGAYLAPTTPATANNRNTATFAATATATGATTGTIPDGADFVTVTSANVNHIVVLPTPTPGTVVRLRNGATGYELRTNAPATVAINGGAAADAESAIPANTLVQCVCGTATTWVCTNISTAGVVSATEVAAAP